MRKSNVTTLNTTTPGTEIDVYVSYKDGKDGFGRAGREPKGYQLHIQPVKRERNGDFIITTARGWSGVKGWIEDTARFSDKRIGQIAATIITSDLYKTGLAQVLETNGLAVA